MPAPCTRLQAHSIPARAHASIYTRTVCTLLATGVATGCSRAGLPALLQRHFLTHWTVQGGEVLDVPAIFGCLHAQLIILSLQAEQAVTLFKEMDVCCAESLL
jgi:hypothetical protein